MIRKWLTATKWSTLTQKPITFLWDPAEPYWKPFMSVGSSSVPGHSSLWSRQRMPAKGESPSSPFYVTVSMKTHQEECRRLHKRGSPVGSAKDKSEDDYPPMSKKMHLKCPLCGPNVQKKTWWNVSRVPFQWRKTDKIASGVPFHFIKCSAI